jgi:KipI family sensor histidine kinase inhibitor
MCYNPPRLLPVGDSALLIELGDEINPAINAQVQALALALDEYALPGLGEAVPAYRSLLWHYDPLLLSFDQVRELAEQALSQAQASAPPEPRLIEIPTCYGGQFGPDLEFVARHNGLKPKDVIHLHSSTLYPVYMLGFSPGFAYLGGLPPAIAAPRLSSPRTQVPAGSVGIAGAQTGIYPIATPGGWRLIGRTPLRLFDPQRRPPALLRPGDRVRFTPIDADRFIALWEREWRAGQQPPVIPSGPGLEVLQPGLLTTVQDLGRRGYERFGVPVAGAMDPFALRAANLLVGNPPGAAALEIMASGVAFRATGDCLIAVAGADLGLQVNGKPIPNWGAALVRRGWRVEFSARRNGPALRQAQGGVLSLPKGGVLSLPRGLWAYLAVSGGVALPPVMNSRSTYLRGELGGLGRALQAGDLVPFAPVDPLLAERAARQLPRRLLPPYSQHPTLQVIPGPQAGAFDQQSLAVFFSSAYQLTPTADRMGYRLQGPALVHQGAADIISDGIALGAIQVPADGQPIVMLADRQTTGGYPKIATVVSADVPLLAQCLPGQSSVRFRQTSVQEAQRRYRRLVHGLGVRFQDSIFDAWQIRPNPL